MSRITTGLLADDQELKMADKMSTTKWEASKKDLSQDKKMAKKKGMSLKQWEASSGDTKHDSQQSMKGLRGGGIAMRGKGIALAGGGMADQAAARQAVQQPPMREPGLGSMNPRKPTMGPTPSRPSMVDPRRRPPVPRERAAFKKGGSVKEASSGEMYKSKSAMKKHEAKESPAMERSEDKMRGGGMALRGKGVALRGGGMATRGMGVALKNGGMSRKGK